MGRMRGPDDLGTDRSARGLVRELGSAITRWMAGRRASEADADAPAEPVARFRVVCIAREAGAGGSTLGRLLARRLNWAFYDEQIIETIAERMEVPIEDVKALDELSPGVIQDWLLPLREEHYAPLEAYLDHLAKLVQAIGQAGEAIIVGRGAGFMLPRSSCLSVRVVAPPKARAQRRGERLGVSARTARRMARDLDHRRDRFVRTMFHVDPRDPHRYDLVLDSDSLGLPIAAEIIARAVEAGLPRPAPSPAPETAGLDGPPPPPEPVA
jgi:cytidylate kinase